MPKRRLTTPYAWDVMSEGMMEGWFTSKKLTDYFDALKRRPDRCQADHQSGLTRAG